MYAHWPGRSRAEFLHITCMSRKLVTPALVPFRPIYGKGTAAAICTKPSKMQR